MGWLKEIEGAASHKGQVVVTRASGESTTFVDLDTAEAACGDLQGKLAYFRGAFFERGTARPERKAATAEKPKPAEAPPAPAPAPATPRRRRRGEGEGEGAGED